MSLQQQPMLVNTSNKARLNLQTKKSTNLQGYRQSQRLNYQNQSLRYDILHQVSEKYLQSGENYVDFSSPKIYHEIEMELNEIKREKLREDSLRKEEGRGESEKMGEKVSGQVQSKKQGTIVNGKSQGSNKYRSTECKESEANKHLQANKNDVDQFKMQDEQKQPQIEGYYQQPYMKMLSYQNFPTQSYNISEHEQFIKQLQTIIFSQVKTMQLKELKGNYILQHITDDLQMQIANYQSRLQHQLMTPQQLLKTRMHIQAISKLMVFIHGKSQFRLVTSHYYIGEAYRVNGCYQQAIDHFTIALKKNTKLTQIKQTKIYHSFILTSLSECYFQLLMYEDALQILLRAYQIQQCYVNSQLKVNNIKTIRLISECYLKMKNYRQAIDYMEKICLIVEKLKGANSKEYAEIKFEKAVIAGEEGNRLGAIEQVKAAIQLVQINITIEPFQKNMIILEYSKKLADFLERFGDSQAQLQYLRQMLKIIDSSKNQGTAPKNFFIKHIIAIKKKIIVISVRQSEFPNAIKELEEVLQLQQEKYGSDSLFVAKTLKMLGLVHLHLGNDMHAEEYFKRCYKLDKQISQMRGEMKDLDRILKCFGYNKRSSLKRKCMKPSSKKMSIV